MTLPAVEIETDRSKKNFIKTMHCHVHVLMELATCMQGSLDTGLWVGGCRTCILYTQVL